MPSYDVVGFHAQQAAEKALKALLVRHAVRFDRTHDLGALLLQAESVAPGIAHTLRQAEELTVHAVSSRYPAQEPALGRAEARQRLAVANDVFTHVQALLRAYLDAGRPSGS
ncbi:MAG: HEPN domain-containing protein [Candidatus Rokubacteria bacterium]|nr:HEPN domain-containing protein [Candidatus Rokubacteria bacterium]